MLNKKMGYIGAAIFVALVIFTLVYHPHVDTNVFENKYVEFKLPNNIKVVDESNETCDLYFFNSTPGTGDKSDPNFIADMRTVKTNYINNASNITDVTLVDGINATEFVDKSSNTFNLFVPVKKRNNALLFEIFLNQSQVTYETVKNSLIIK
ncbi:hypothetical protein Metbo_1224 [Methanobacterium lacus]|uniref:Uncharacterized protein n=1 Tax=Methanobacterium lacus (strain AL-21) TaxID=877455 RepID=F0T6U6_METLA|nr:hypothetical protein [Methanobacterium lacus]ADZ09466.1 hypothetical protein Metbo_1224 [Methanobacterium lacus]